MNSGLARAEGLAPGACASTVAAVVLVDGWLISDEKCDEELAMLAQAAYRVAAITLRGYGKSDNAAGASTFDVFADDIRELTGVTFGGFSLVDAIAIRYLGHDGAAAPAVGTVAS
jgi:pimeloyl-ACP methyl ester carboxylesterase